MLHKICNGNKFFFVRLLKPTSFYQVYSVKHEKVITIVSLLKMPFLSAEVARVSFPVLKRNSHFFIIASELKFLVNLWDVWIRNLWKLFFSRPDWGEVDLSKAIVSNRELTEKFSSTFLSRTRKKKLNVALVLSIYWKSFQDIKSTIFKFKTSPFFLLPAMSWVGTSLETWWRRKRKGKKKQRENNWNVN